MYLPTYAQVTLAYDTGSAPMVFAADQLREVYSSQGISLVPYHYQQLDNTPDIAVILPGSHPLRSNRSPDFSGLKKEGFRIKKGENGQIQIVATDEVGGQYGLLHLMEHFREHGDYQSISDILVNPALEYRIVKFNLPWSPYRDSEATRLHTHTCRDLGFWERFLDMMVENRLNVLSLWNNHPFPYMIRAENFPKASPFDEQEMKEWKAFWKNLLRMAKNRGIQTFIVNWNIVVSPEFAEAYGADEYNDLSDQVKRYTKESVTQVINEYPDLTGIGVTLADWMGTFDDKMTPEERENWIAETFISGMKSAERKVKFIHRSVLAGDPMAMRAVLDKADLEDPALVEIKFNWSHGHSTPKLAITHDYHSGELDNRFWEPMPENYRIQWMVRNEDFFILRWGDPDFVRAHIRQNNHAYVNGYFIGSEGYIPAKDYSHLPSPEKTWQYGFEKQWMFYKVWGRLLYDPETPDHYFEMVLANKYGENSAKDLLASYKLASKVPLKLASFYRSTWDYTLYAEGFIAAEPSSGGASFDRSSPFISILEWMDHETLDPNLLSIKDFGNKLQANEPIGAELTTPLELADEIEKDCMKALSLLEDLALEVSPFSGALKSEIEDLMTWSYLGLYMADKIRAGVALTKFKHAGEQQEKEKAIGLLKHCLSHWDKVIHYTKDRYRAVPHVSTEHYDSTYTQFSWELLRPQVVRDIELAQHFNKKNN